MWRDLREELHPLGLEVVTVALDTGGWEHARPWIEKAAPTHPSLLDAEHTLDELFGVVNVPSGIWIDEQRVIVRPPEPAFPGKAMFAELMRNIEIPEDGDPYTIRALRLSREIRHEPERYVAALRDWARNGAASRYVLSPDEVIARARPRGPEASEAAARFELGQHLWRKGHHHDAVPNFKRAHELQPENWTYKRQAWQFVSPLLQNAVDVYGTSWAAEVERIGAENYYPPLEL